MTDQELRELIDNLRALPTETELVEFKYNKAIPFDIAKYISAISNSARLHNQPQGYIVWGIDDNTHDVLGTSFSPAKMKGQGNEPLESWLNRNLSPQTDFRIHSVEYEPGKTVVIFEIDPVRERPLCFNDIAYIRVGTSTKKLIDLPAKRNRLEFMLSGFDWTAEICHGASLSDLDPVALESAKVQFRLKHPRLIDEMKSWDDLAFLNKAKLTIDGKVTRAAIILIGKSESSHYLSPSVARITWVLKDEFNNEKDYEHFDVPLLLSVDEVFHKLRNLKIRALPDGTLFPKEISQYDSWVIREALHNAIAHQDYSLRHRVNIVEKPDELVISNAGSFLPGSVDEVIKHDNTPSYYRNTFLANAMMNLNMIDTIGSGIRRMFSRQKERFFPLPDFDLSDPNKVRVSIPGRILDENYTRMLMNNIDMPLEKVMLLDRVQKGIIITPRATKILRKERLIEGRYPMIYISSKVAGVTGQKAHYIKHRGLDDSHYIELVKEYLRKYGSASRNEIDELLLDKLPGILTEEQKLNKITKILSFKMSKSLGIIQNVGTNRKSKWVLVKKD